MVEEGDACADCKTGKMHAKGYVEARQVKTNTFLGLEKKRRYQCDNSVCGKEMQVWEKSFSIRMSDSETSGVQFRN